MTEDLNEKKLKNIKDKIKEFKKPLELNLSSQKEITPFTIGIDLVSGTMIGVIIGVIIDKYYETKPLFLIICTIFGIIAGFNIIFQKFNKKH